MKTTTSKTATTPALTVGVRVRIEKGCKAREVDKGTTAEVISVEPMGAEYSHYVRVGLRFLNGFKAGRTMSFYARHINRLNDAFVAMNDGNSGHRIEVRRISSAPRPVAPPPVVAVTAPVPPEAQAAPVPIEIHAFMQQANGGRLRSFEAGGFSVMVQAHENDAAQAAFVARLAAFCEGFA